MSERIRQIHQDSYESYGMSWVHAELIEQDVCISRLRVARLMREAGIHGISKRRGVTLTTRRNGRQTPANRSAYAICSYMDASQVASALRVGRIGGLHFYIRPVDAGIVARWP